MSIIIVVLPLLGLIGVAVVFGVTYKRNGLKAAFITTGIALFVFSILYAAAIYVRASAMP
jgi:hypothetical protein